MPIRDFAIAALITYSAATSAGCGNRVASTPQAPPHAQEYRTSRLSSESINLEALEAETALQTGTPTEAKNLRLSQLWHARAEELSNVPGPGAIAALLRSAHFALESLLSEPCANPFNETCRDLHKVYLTSTEEIVRAVARNGWELPQLAPSKYRFSNTDAEKLRTLRHWRFSLDSAPAKGPLDRPGLGLPAVGCREGWGDSEAELHGLSICSPITFIVSFERSTQEEQPTAHLAAVNAYEQEVFETRGTAIPIASATTAALDTLLRGADAAGGPGRLWCLSRPTRSTTMALVVISAPSTATSYTQALATVAADTTLQSSYTPCVYPAQSGGALASATSLLRLMRLLVAPRKDATVERDPIRILPLLSGKEAVNLARGMLARIKRQAHRASRAPSQPPPFAVSAIALNSNDADPVAMQDISRYAADLNAPLVIETGEADLVRDTPNILLQNHHIARPDEPQRVPISDRPADPEELPLSPVM